MAFLLQQAVFAEAQTLKVEPSISTEIAFTDNANLSRERISDWVLKVRPALKIEQREGRFTGRMDYAIDAVTHSRAGVEDRQVNSFDLNARLEAVENFFFVDFRSRVSGENFSVFAPIALDNLTGSDNRTEVRSHGISPWIYGRLNQAATYSLRADLSTLEGNREGFVRSRNTRLSGSLNGELSSQFGWGLSWDQNALDYPDRESLKTDALRARLRYFLNSQSNVFLTYGREHNDYSSQRSTLTLRGAGADLQFGPRTRLRAERERRFFGHSSLVRASHRGVHLATSLEFSKDVSSTNQELFSAGPGNLFQAVFDLYTPRYSDPLQRLDKVADLFRRTGLPFFLTRPFAFYVQQPFVERGIKGTLALLGARNTLAASAYRTQRQALASGFALMDDFSFGNQIQTRGFALDWRLLLAHQSSVSLTYTQAHNRTADGSTDNRSSSLVGGLQLPLSASGKSLAFGQLRHNRGEGSQVDYRENAALAGVRISF